MLDELYEEQVEIVQAADVTSARNLMIAIRQVSREIEKAQETKKAVLATYDARLQTLEERKAKAEGHLRDYLLNANGGEKLALPDVGTAYLAKSKPKLEIVDKTAVEATFGNLFSKTVFDATAFKKAALEGVLDTGEIPEGCAYVPEAQDLRIREA